MRRLHRPLAAIERHGPRLRDLLFILLSGLWTWMVAASDDPGAGGALGTAMIGAVCSLALWWRRRYPLAVTMIALGGQAGAWTLPALGFVLLATGPFVLGTFVALGADTGTRRDLVVSLRDLGA